MATKDGRSQIWYADGNGNVEGYTETVDNIAETIIGTYNEHFGTDIQLWTPETKTLQVGGTVPNWNAYEKIEFSQIVFVKYFIEYSSHYMAGHIDYDNMILKIWSQANEQALVQFDTAGKWVGGGGQPQWNTDFLNAVIAKGINVVSAEFEDIPNMQPQDTIENWSEYVEV